MNPAYLDFVWGFIAGVLIGAGLVLRHFERLKR